MMANGSITGGPSNGSVDISDAVANPAVVSIAASAVAASAVAASALESALLHLRFLTGFLGLNTDPACWPAPTHPPGAVNAIGAQPEPCPSSMDVALHVAQDVEAVGVAPVVVVADAPSLVGPSDSACLFLHRYTGTQEISRWTLPSTKPATAVTVARLRSTAASAASIGRIELLASMI